MWHTVQNAHRASYQAQHSIHRFALFPLLPFIIEHDFGTAPIAVTAQFHAVTMAQATVQRRPRQQSTRRAGQQLKALAGRARRQVVGREFQVSAPPRGRINLLKVRERAEFS